MTDQVRLPIGQVNLKGLEWLLPQQLADGFSVHQLDATHTGLLSEVLP
jgi:hypothetical protein